MEWKLLTEEKPKHKDLVLCWNGTITLPAIYYDNQSFNGFWFFTTFYHEYSPTIYSKVKLKPKHEITGVLKWRHIDEPFCIMEDSHKKATEMIIKLQDKNAKLRIAILKLTTLCDRTKQHLVSEIWAQQIGYAKQIIEETEK